MTKKTEDEAILAEALTRQDTEISDLRRQLRSARFDVRAEKLKRIISNGWLSTAFGLAITGLLSLAGWAIYMNITTPLTPTGCRVGYSDSAWTEEFYLKQVIPWHQDPILGYFKTIEEATRSVELLKCPILTPASGAKIR